MNLVILSLFILLAVMVIVIGLLVKYINQLFERVRDLELCRTYLENDLKRACKSIGELKAWNNDLTKCINTLEERTSGL